MSVLALLGLTFFHLHVLLVAAFFLLYIVQKEDKREEVFSWVGLCCVILGVGLAFTLTGCGQASPKPVLPASTQEIPTSEAVATISGSQLTVVVDVPKGGRVGEVVVQFNKAIYEGSLSDACGGWYRAQDMWGLTWAVKVDGNALILSPADHRHDLVEGTWTVHISWYRGTELGQLHSVEVK